jgi:hypothetical protein
MVSSVRLRDAASPGVGAAVAPRARSGSALPGERFQTSTSWPASRSRSAMRLPIAPAPTTATGSIYASEQRERLLDGGDGIRDRVENMTDLAVPTDDQGEALQVVAARNAECREPQRRRELQPLV